MQYRRELVFKKIISHDPFLPPLLPLQTRSWSWLLHNAFLYSIFYATESLFCEFLAFCYLLVPPLSPLPSRQLFTS